MKIVLGHDYYDGAQSLGMDESIKLIRSPEIMNAHDFSQHPLKKAIAQTPLEELLQNNFLHSFKHTFKNTALTNGHLEKWASTASRDGHSRTMPKFCYNHAASSRSVAT